jgi:hypothetical protein
MVKEYRHSLCARGPAHTLLTPCALFRATATRPVCRAVRVRVYELCKMPVEDAGHQEL